MKSRLFGSLSGPPLCGKKKHPHIKGQMEGRPVEEAAFVNAQRVRTHIRIGDL